MPDIYYLHMHLTWHRSYLLVSHRLYALRVGGCGDALFGNGMRLKP